jgi:cysteinyl-tRNA synthetase
MFDSDQKRIDELHYELGSYQERMRNLENQLNIKSLQVQGLVILLSGIRRGLRDTKNFEIADMIRDAMRQLDLDVIDDPIKKS